MVAADDDSLSFEREFLAQLPLVERVISFVARRNHLTSADADDFASTVRLKLVEDGYAVFRKFQGRSSLRTYLTVVVQREFVEFQRARWGKWHPSAEARRGGTVVTLLEQYLVRDGYSLAESCEMLATKHGVTLARTELEALAARLPVRFARRFESDEALANMPSTHASPDQAVADEHRARLESRASAALAEAKRRLADEDRLILAYRFEDGLKVADIARMLRIEQKSLYRRIDGLLRQLRAELETQRIDADALRGLFEEH